MKTNRPIEEVLARFGGNLTRCAAAVAVSRQALSAAIRSGRFSRELALALEAATGVSAVRLVFGDEYARQALPRKAPRRKAA